MRFAFEWWCLCEYVCLCLCGEGIFSMENDPSPDLRAINCRFSKNAIRTRHDIQTCSEGIHKSNWLPIHFSISRDPMLLEILFHSLQISSKAKTWKTSRALDINHVTRCTIHRRECCFIYLPLHTLQPPHSNEQLNVFSARINAEFYSFHCLFRGHGARRDDNEWERIRFPIGWNWKWKLIVCTNSMQWNGNDGRK